MVNVSLVYDVLEAFAITGTSGSVLGTIHCVDGREAAWS